MESNTQVNRNYQRSTLKRDEEERRERRSPRCYRCWLSCLTRNLISTSHSSSGGPSFDEHLKGVMLVLRAWNCSKSVQLSGLFHSIYGTEGFQGHSIPFTRRSEIKKKIGDRAETLAYTFCVVDRLSVDESVKAEFEGTGTRKLKADIF